MHAAPARSRAGPRVSRRTSIIERYHNFGGEAIRPRAAARRAGGARGQCAGRRLSGIGEGAIDRALLVEPMRRWRDRHVRARRSSSSRPSAAILPAGHAAAEDPRARMGRRHRPLPSRRRRPGPFDAAGAMTVAVFAGAFRAWHGADPPGRRRSRHLRARGRHGHRRGADRRRPGAAAGPRGGRSGLDARSVHRRAAARSDAGGAGRGDIGVAPFDVGRARAAALGFYWSPLKIFEYMAAGLPVVAPAVDRIPSLVGHEREGLLYDPIGSTSLADALVRLADDPALRRRLGAAARARAVRDYSWDAHCRALELAAIDARRIARAARGVRDPASRPTRFRPSAAAAAGAPTSWRAGCARAATT